MFLNYSAVVLLIFWGGFYVLHLLVFSSGYRGGEHCAFWLKFTWTELWEHFGRVKNDHKKVTCDLKQLKHLSNVQPLYMAIHVNVDVNLDKCAVILGTYHKCSCGVRSCYLFIVFFNYVYLFCLCSDFWKTFIWF